MRVTNKRISEAIEAETGHPGVKVHVDRENGYAWFYSEEPGPIDSVYSASVYCVSKLSDLTVQQWVNEYKDKIEELNY